MPIPEKDVSFRIIRGYQIRGGLKREEVEVLR